MPYFIQFRMFKSWGAFSRLRHEFYRISGSLLDVLTLGQKASLTGVEAGKSNVKNLLQTA